MAEVRVTVKYLDAIYYILRQKNGNTYVQKLIFNDALLLLFSIICRASLKWNYVKGKINSCNPGNV